MKIAIFYSLTLNLVPLIDVSREGNGTLLQYSCLENPMDRGAWQAAVHGVAKSQTRLSNFHFSLSCIGEGNGNPLQCSCLENPRDGGAWWAAVSGVTQSRTRLKRLSSSIDVSIICLSIKLNNPEGPHVFTMGFPGGSDSKESACSAGDLSSIHGLGRSPGEGNDYPLQYSCLENSMVR